MKASFQPVLDYLRALDPQKNARVIVTIKIDPKVQRPISKEIDAPMSRVERRRILIENQASANREATDGVRTQIESLGLKIHGGRLMPVLVVEGLPGRIEDIFGIEGIASIELDSQISIETMMLTTSRNSYNKQTVE